MSINSSNVTVHCNYLDKNHSDLADKLPLIEVFFAETKELSLNYSEFSHFFNKEDSLKAAKFHSERDRDTYLYCHTLLRLFLSDKLKKNPDEISFGSGKFNKPFLNGNLLYFNISHTRDSFAFAVSENTGVGIDLEKSDRKINLNSISKRFFSKEENVFISESPDETIKRFFLLWTRKEALLKALGTGIISNPSGLEVFRQKNAINMELISNLTGEPLGSDYFIYSREISDYFLSVAVSQESKILIHKSFEDSGKNFLLSLLGSFF
jgi:4'-phosphopantetheinyl transferase